MPTYEYACSSCGRRFEVVQSFSDDPLTTCEVCQGTLKRVFHPVGVVLKGSGFYATDNRSKGGKALSPGTKESKESKGGSEGSSSKPESSSGSSKTSGSDP